ncbi:hypothetical protein [Hyalangium sp.]|uniref:hypothetical protein n=1 Tax=Hyalangium sp. TaxID=2028555 RepID=UPI00389985B5
MAVTVLSLAALGCGTPDAEGRNGIASENPLASDAALVELGLRKFKTPYPTLLIGNWVGGVFRNVDGWVQVHP